MGDGTEASLTARECPGVPLAPGPPFEDATEYRFDKLLLDNEYRAPFRFPSII
jgi:hypothetical protein